jgi:glycine oxidase
MSYDAIIIGGGLVGGSIAWHMADDGAKVLLLERGQVGMEGSWAAAGVLTEIVPRTIPEVMSTLIGKGLEYFGPAVERVEAETGIKCGFERSGMLRVAFDESELDDLRRYAETTSAEGLEHEWLEPSQVRAQEPLLAGHVIQGLYLPNAHQVDNAVMTAAVVKAAEQKGAEVLTGNEVTGWLRDDDGRVTGVTVGEKRLEAPLTVLAAGAWSGALAGQLGLELPVKPVRGQILVLKPNGVKLRHMINARSKYVVPREHAILIGSTQEFDAGFDKQPTAAGLREILEFIHEALPGMEDCPVIDLWAGLRPGSPDEAPYIGTVDGVPGLWIAAGHFTKGIVLGPLTGKLVADAIRTGEADPILASFSPQRHVGKADGDD